MRKTATRRALIVGCLLQAIQQLAGINTVMYYTATIIEMSGVQSQSIAVWLAVPTAAVYVIFSFCGYLLADRLGRRPLTLGSLMGVILSLLVLGTGFQLTSMNGAVVTTHNMTTLESCYSKRDCSSCIAEPRCGFCYDAQNLAVASCLEKNLDDNTRSIGGPCAEGSGNSNFVFANHICPSMTQGIGLNTWLVLTGLVMYLAAFAPGMGPMPWTINSEIYPMWVRSFCYSIATSVNWMFNLLISLTFISLTEVLTTHGAFYMYSIIASIGWLLLFWKLPETRGRSLEDISSLFAKHKPDDQEIMDDEVSGGAGGGGAGGAMGALGGGTQLSVVTTQVATGGHRHSVVLCHDNLAFSADQSTQASQAAKGAVDASILVQRSRSFKLASPLARAANLAISQPDLQAHVQHQHQQQQQQHQQQHNQTKPAPPPTSTATIATPAALSSQALNLGQTTKQTTQQQEQQLQQQSQSKRKYSDSAH